MKVRIARGRKLMLSIIIAVIAVAGLLVGTYGFHLFGFQSVDCWARPASEPNTAVFTIVMADEGVNVGYNGSAKQVGTGIPWPVVNVTQGQNVIIHLINNDTQAHGFVIVHYFTTGLRGGVAPGSCYDVRFAASVQGSFAIECDIICSIHYAMLNGRLNVNP